MTTITGPMWLIAGVCVLAVAGFCALFVLAAEWLSRVRDWLVRDRVTPLLDRGKIPRGIDADCWYDTHEDCPGCGCVCHQDQPPLPPERTWEQMTSHQLPVAVQESGDGQRGDASDHRGPGWPVNGVFAGMSPAERKHWHRLERNRKRRAGRAEMGYRAHYVAMGFDYPSGLMARVRELAP